MFLLNYTVLRVDPELMEDRSKPGEGTKKWDKRILGLSFIAAISMYATAGLDSGRFHWSPEFHWSIYSTGIILTVGGQLLFLFAQKQNKFFFNTMQIQKERVHTVCDTGLYKVVRHPAYLGSVIQSIGFPLLIGSLWSIVPVSLIIILSVIRTYLEDITLKKELAGYREYSDRSRYKMIPFVW